MDIITYARQLNENAEWTRRSYEPVEVAAKHEELKNIRTVLFDVYGTLIDCYRSEFSDDKAKQSMILDGFKKVIDDFYLADALFDMDPEKDPAVVLRDLYHGLIMVTHENRVKQGFQYPEIKIEEIWKILLQMFSGHGYEMPMPGWKDMDEMALAMAYLYNFSILGRRLYPGVLETLKMLKKKEIRVGVVSDAQFYTSLDLSLFLAVNGQDNTPDINGLIPLDHSFYSYQHGITRKNPQLYRTALRYFDKNYGIKPQEILYIGNDYLNDICTAKDAGMRTGLFCGDKESLILGDAPEKLKNNPPDIIIDHLPVLLMKI